MQGVRQLGEACGACTCCGMSGAHCPDAYIATIPTNRNSPFRCLPPNPFPHSCWAPTLPVTSCRLDRTQLPANP